MAKLAQNFAKYMVHAKMEASGTVEKPDVIGAIFGQTEGLLGQDLDLRELQKTGRIGRIEVKLKTIKGNTTAEVLIPSSLDASETALIAAALETIEKVGPCSAQTTTTCVEDVRTQKRKFVIERAKNILRDMTSEFSESQNIADHIRESVRSYEISIWKGLSCGSDMLSSDDIIIVEGRGDVINLVKHGIRTCVAIEGSKIPEPIIELCKEKVVTALLDGDRGGDLILRKLFSTTEIDFVARAEEGKEVEELTKKQLFKSLRDKVPAYRVMRELGDIPQPPAHEIEKEEHVHLQPETRRKFLGHAEELIGTRAAFLLDGKGRLLSKVPVGELSLMIQDYPETEAVIIDSRINQDLVDMAIHRRIKCLVGTGVKEEVRSPKSLLVLTPEELKSSA